MKEDKAKAAYIQHLDEQIVKLVNEYWEVVGPNEQERHEVTMLFWEELKDKAACLTDAVDTFGKFYIATEVVKLRDEIERNSEQERRNKQAS